VPRRYKGKGKKAIAHSTNECSSDVGSSKKPKPTNNKTLTFKATGTSQNATYNNVLKEFRLEALSFSGHGDAAKMLQMGQEVDLESLEPQLLIYPETETNRENLQNAAHRVHDKKMERWEKRVELYDTHKRNLCTLIARKCEQDLLDKLENLPDYMEFSFNNPLRFLQAIRHECVTFEEDEWPIAI
jgi:hypothetical protein